MRKPDPKRARRVARGPSQRQLRAGESVRRALADIVGRGTIRDPDLANVTITISEVRVSNDMRHATCFVAPLGGGDAEKLAQALTRAKAYIRGQLGKELTFKFLPDLTFLPDLSFDQAEMIERLLHSPKVAQDLAHDGGDDEDEETDEDEPDIDDEDDED